VCGGGVWQGCVGGAGGGGRECRKGKVCNGGVCVLVRQGVGNVGRSAGCGGMQCHVPSACGVGIPAGSVW